jgi:hypothetical protein
VRGRKGAAKTRPVPIMKMIGIGMEDDRFSHVQFRRMHVSLAEQSERTGEL